MEPKFLFLGDPNACAHQSEQYLDAWYEYASWAGGGRISLGWVYWECDFAWRCEGGVAAVVEEWVMEAKLFDLVYVVRYVLRWEETGVGLVELSFLLL